MNPHDSHDATFDARARAVHARSLEQLSPRVQAQLAQRRRAALQGAAPRRSRGLLPWAGVATAGLALALVVQLRPPAPHGATPAPAARVATPGTRATGMPATAPRITAVEPSQASPGRVDADAIAPDLTEDPEFYLWLGDERPARTE